MSWRSILADTLTLEGYPQKSQNPQKPGEGGGFWGFWDFWG